MVSPSFFFFWWPICTNDPNATGVICKYLLAGLGCSAWMSGSSACGQNINLFTLIFAFRIQRHKSNIARSLRSKMITYIFQLHIRSHKQTSAQTTAA